MPYFINQMQWLLILLDHMILCAWLLFKGVAFRGWCSLKLCMNVVKYWLQKASCWMPRDNIMRFGWVWIRIIWCWDLASGVQKMRTKMANKHTLLSTVLLTADWQVATFFCFAITRMYYCTQSLAPEDGNYVSAGIWSVKYIVSSAFAWWR